jgi:hypothetical protein
MSSSIVEDIAALEEQHQSGCLSDLQFAAAVVSALPAPAADDAARQPVWLNALSTAVAGLDAQWKQEQLDRHAIPIRCGCILPSRAVAAHCCAWSLVAFVLIPAAVFPAFVYRWAIEFERAESDFQRRRAAVILGALRRKTEGAEPSAAPAREA